LEKKGLVIGKWERLASGQERRYYNITEKGKHALKEKVTEWRGFSKAVNSIMLPESP
jgi:PadR family transcriptional regulator PadR